jgi:DNA processing protein
MSRPPDGSTLPALRARGCWPLPDAPRVAVVGARRPTTYGEAVAERLAADLAGAGVVVVSGLAVGVDTAAHLGALQGGGRTVAVLGTGVDIIYPAVNAPLARRIVDEGGALLSQFPDGTRPRRHHFPQRNWVIANLCQIVVVVEAADGSGALITAEAALDLGRQVMAVPGSVFSPLSVGCHQLLRDGAGLVQDSRDVLAELHGPTAVLDEAMRPPARLGTEAPPSGKGMLRHLVDGVAVDAGRLADRLGLPVGEVVARLSQLELEGRVKRTGGGYVRVHRRETSRVEEE